MDTRSRLPEPDPCEQALLNQHARLDRLFFTVVTGMGIYCRPVYPARAPKRENARYYANALASEAAGFLPPLHCRPGLASGNPEWERGGYLVAHALKLIDARVLAQQSLAELALQAGACPRP